MTVAIAIVGIVDGCVRRRIHRWSPTTIEKHGGACARAPDQCCIEIPRCGRGGDACLFSLAYSRFLFSLVSRLSNPDNGPHLTPAERAEPSWQALVGLRVQASAVGIVGPDELSEIARDLLGRAKVIDAMTIDGTPEGKATAEIAQQELGAIAEQFEHEARRLLRPTPRQKSGRTRRVLRVDETPSDQDFCWCRRGDRKQCPALI